MMQKPESSFFIDSIRKEDKKALPEIYKFCFPQVRHYIVSNSGNLFDAEDIFQDALVIIYHKIKNNNFALSSSFSTYLNGIVRYLWLKELERKRKFFEINIASVEHLTSESDFFEDYNRLEKRKLILDHFSGMNEECRKILDLHLNETPVSRITALMGYSSDQYTKNRRTVCKERLVKSIWNNPRFKELKNEAYQKDTKVPRW